jgi:hypothetical protein
MRCSLIIQFVFRRRMLFSRPARLLKGCVVGSLLPNRMRLQAYKSTEQLYAIFCSGQGSMVWTNKERVAVNLPLSRLERVNSCRTA